MNVHLLLPEGQAAPESLLILAKENLTPDMEMNALLDGISNGDKCMRDTLSNALYAPLTDLKLIAYRHEALNDAIAHPDEVRALYDLCLEAEARRTESAHWRLNLYHDTTFTGAVDYLMNFTKTLIKLRKLAESDLKIFRSAAFTDLFRMLREELSDDYLNSVKNELTGLNLTDGVFLSAGLGSYLQGVNYVMHRREKKLFGLDRLKGQTYKLAEGDDPGTDMTGRQDRAIVEATNALAQAAEHLASFFDVLRSELSFYVGCLNFMNMMKGYGMPTCIPTLTEMSSTSRSWEELSDVALICLKKAAVTGNTLKADNKQLYIVTGANKGGKTTFLRSFGQAQLMAQCGMPVAAKSYTGPLRGSLYSHFKREEDKYMQSGKLDEELERLSRIANCVKKGDVILFNEAFSSTNEREGSEIARQITEALIESGIEIIFVSHQHAYATSFRDRKEVQFLRAERLDGGKRTFRILPGEPLETAFGEDLYIRIFGE